MKIKYNKEIQEVLVQEVCSAARRCSNEDQTADMAGHAPHPANGIVGLQSTGPNLKKLKKHEIFSYIFNKRQEHVHWRVYTFGVLG